ncbi:MAG: hypothetical protein GQ542_18550 [Desulforhopalus sp.]|jgi:hypothetical protein|nr:hypothetical protein [Desulforhopalus sp.]
MSVLKCDDMLYAVGQQKLKNLGSGNLISDSPAIIIKPFSNRRKNAPWENMYMGVDNGWKTRRKH